MRTSVRTMLSVLNFFGFFSEWKWVHLVEETGVFKSITEGKPFEMENYGWDVAETPQCVFMQKTFQSGDMVVSVIYNPLDFKLTTTIYGNGKRLTVEADGNRSTSNMALEHHEVSEP